jgi:hypothetical protein
METRGQLHVLVALPLWRGSRCSLDKRLGGPRSRPGRRVEQKSFLSLPARFLGCAAQNLVAISTELSRLVLLLLLPSSSSLTIVSSQLHLLFLYTSSELYFVYRMKPRFVLLLGTGFLYPNNPLNMYAFMQEKLPEYVRKIMTFKVHTKY